MPKEKIKKEKVHYIYKIHFLCGFPAGRYYLGKHTGHIDDAYAGSGDFCKAYYKKYGKVNGVTYIKEIIEVNPDKKINDSREKIAVGDLWKTDPLCMNQKPGGDTGIGEHRIGISVPEEVRQKISASLKGYKHSEETINKIRKARIGKKLSEETKAKISSSNRKSRATPIYQLSLDDKILATFSSSRDVERQLGYKHQNIISCCNGKHKTAYGYKWRYKED